MASGRQTAAKFSYPIFLDPYLERILAKGEEEKKHKKKGNKNGVWG